jgi:hypothetical protein
MGAYLLLLCIISVNEQARLTALVNLTDVQAVSGVSGPGTENFSSNVQSWEGGGGREERERDLGMTTCIVSWK